MTTPAAEPGTTDDAPAQGDETDRAVIFLGGLPVAAGSELAAVGMAESLKEACNFARPDAGPWSLALSESPATSDPWRRVGTLTPKTPGAGKTVAVYVLDWTDGLLSRWRGRSALVRLCLVVVGLLNVKSFCRFFVTAGAKNTRGRLQLSAAAIMVVALGAYAVVLAATVVALAVGLVAGATDDYRSTRPAPSTSEPGSAAPSTSPISASAEPSPASPSTEQAAGESKAPESSPAVTEPAAQESSAQDLLDNLWVKLSLGTSLVGGVVIAVFRKPLSTLVTSGEMIAVAHSYLVLADGQGEACTALTRLIAMLRSESPDRPITVVAYSFGGFVAVDTFYPTSGTAPTVLSTVDRLVTIGMPFDFGRALRPTWVRAERATGGKPVWINTYASIDLFGSNFRRDKGQGSSQLGFGGSDEQTNKVVPGTNVQWTVDVEPRLVNLLAFYGFISHGMYWSKDGSGRNVFVKIIDEVVPPDQAVTKE